MGLSLVLYLQTAYYNASLIFSSYKNNNKYIKRILSEGPIYNFPLPIEILDTFNSIVTL